MSNTLLTMYEPVFKERIFPTHTALITARAIAAEWFATGHVTSVLSDALPLVNVSMALC